MRTPGPWTWNKDDTDECLVGADGFSILSGVWYNTSDAGAEIRRDEDARLISAAPDYHEAAALLIQRHDAEARKFNFAKCGCEECHPFRLIYAKAEGAS